MNQIEQTNEFVVTATPVTSHCIDIFINNTIEHSNQFLTAIQTIDGLNEGDVLKIHLNSGGGCLYSTDAFLRSLSDAQARGVETVAICTGIVASAATLIMLSCNDVVISPNTAFLFHCGGIAEGGTFAEFKASSAFGVRWMENIFKRYYSDVLEPIELERMMEGSDIWLTGDEMMNRFIEKDKTRPIEYK